LSGRQGSIPVSCGRERAVQCFFKYAKYVLRCEDANVVIVEPQYPKTDSNKLAGIGDLHRQRDFAYLESEGDQPRCLHPWRTLHVERCDLQSVFHHCKHESAPGLQPRAAEGRTVDGVRQRYGLRSEEHTSELQS